MFTWYKSDALKEILSWKFPEISGKSASDLEEMVSGNLCASQKKPRSGPSRGADAGKRRKPGRSTPQLDTLFV